MIQGHRDRQDQKLVRQHWTFRHQIVKFRHPRLIQSHRSADDYKQFKILNMHKTFLNLPFVKIQNSFFYSISMSKYIFGNGSVSRVKCHHSSFNGIKFADSINSCKSILLAFQGHSPLHDHTSDI